MSKSNLFTNYEHLSSIHNQALNETLECCRKLAQKQVELYSQSLAQVQQFGEQAKQANPTNLFNNSYTLWQQLGELVTASLQDSQQILKTYWTNQAQLGQSVTDHFKTRSSNVNSMFNHPWFNHLTTTNKPI